MQGPLRGARRQKGQRDEKHSKAALLPTQYEKCGPSSLAHDALPLLGGEGRSELLRGKGEAEHFAVAARGEKRIAVGRPGQVGYGVAKGLADLLMS